MHLKHTKDWDQNTTPRVNCKPSHLSLPWFVWQRARMQATAVTRKPRKKCNSTLQTGRQGAQQTKWEHPKNDDKIMYCQMPKWNGNFWQIRSKKKMGKLADEELHRKDNIQKFTKNTWEHWHCRPKKKAEKYLAGFCFANFLRTTTLATNSPEYLTPWISEVKWLSFLHWEVRLEPWYEGWGAHGWGSIARGDLSASTGSSGGVGRGTARRRACGSCRRGIAQSTAGRGLSASLSEVPLGHSSNEALLWTWGVFKFQKKFCYFALFVCKCAFFKFFCLGMNWKYSSDLSLRLSRCKFWNHDVLRIAKKNIFEISFNAPARWNA